MSNILLNLAMSSNAVVLERLVITNDFLKHPWVPETKSAGGLKFIKLDKWCRQLCLFVTGKGLDLRQGKRQDINCRFLEELQRLRTLASDKAISELLQPPPGEEARKAKKARKARASDVDIAPTHVVIRVPGVFRGEQLYPEMLMNVMFGVKNSPICIEATASNLEHIRAGILESLDSVERGRHWKEANAQEGSQEADNQHVSEDVVSEEH
jgi:hypothetical protein